MHLKDKIMTEEFILNKMVEDVLEEAVIAMMDLRDDFTSLPVVDYLCSSLIIKITGLLEQKFRAVVWTLASHDRDYRRDFLNNRFGEYSNFESKQGVYKLLVGQIKKIADTKFTIEHNAHLEESKKLVLEKFGKTIIHSNLNRDYDDFKNNIAITNQINIDIDPKDKRTITLIPNEKIKELFENLIHKDRNRIAHNTDTVQSVKNNLHLLFTESDDTRNYFIKIFVLLYIDKVLDQTYKRYKELFDNANFFL